MSRTEIYNMMENRNVNLSLGSNAFDFIAFNNGAGFLENLTNKFYNYKPNSDAAALAGLDSPAWLMELNNDNTIDNELSDTYSLDDILEGKSILSPVSSVKSSDFMETPIGSPLSSSDESSYDLDELIHSACPEEVLSSTVESSSIPLAEHMYALMTPTVNDDFNGMGKEELSPISVDSGFSSGDETEINSQDLLTQLLSGDLDLSAMLEASEELQPTQSAVSTVDFTAVELQPPQPAVSTVAFTAVSEDQTNVKEKEDVSINMVSDSTVRYSPYKKKYKTVEQRQRKKAQNRNAASRYRSKKNKELEGIFNEANELETKNKELRGKVDGLKTEIDYLKNLMLDVIKARLSQGNNDIDSALSNTPVMSS